MLSDPPQHFIPNFQDLMLSAVNHTILVDDIAEILEVKYLSPAESAICFPLFGILYGPHRRVMVNLSCRRKSSKKQHQMINIIFLCDTGMPCSYLSGQAMSALIGNFDYIPNVMRVEFGIYHHDFQLSPTGSHFAEVNVLGMDFLYDMDLSILLDKKTKRVELRQSVITA